MYFNFLSFFPFPSLSQIKEVNPLLSLNKEREFDQVRTRFWKWRGKRIKESVLFVVLCFFFGRGESAAQGRQWLGATRSAVSRAWAPGGKSYRCQRQMPRGPGSVAASGELWEVQDSSHTSALRALSPLLIPPFSGKSLTNWAQNRQRGVAVGPVTLPAVGLWSGYSHPQAQLHLLPTGTLCQLQWPVKVIMIKQPEDVNDDTSPRRKSPLNDKYGCHWGRKKRNFVQWCSSHLKQQNLQTYFPTRGKLLNN